MAVMQGYGQVLNSQVVAENALDIAVQAQAAGMNIYQSSISLLDHAHAAVAEVSTPTTGGGSEIEHCAGTGKPLLILQHREVRTSPYLTGLSDRCPNIRFVVYDALTDAFSLVHDFLSSIPHRPFNGKFIVLDGPDLCGKGTQHRLLVSYLLDHPLDRDNKLMTVVATREPYNTHYQAEIRKILKESMDTHAKAERLTELFIKDRKVHVANEINPGIARGAVVLSDRYKYSTLAYQSAQGISIEKIVALHHGMPVPDIVFFVDVPLEERLKRKAAVRDRPFEEVFEKDQEFQAKLDEQYDLVARLHPDDHIVRINGNRPVAEIHQEISGYVDKLLFPEAAKDDVTK
ncbi:dTMP kinase [Candidatus Woesearchaeota archaeon]|nr:dTMP kinase [Candidatus Woesearchaeota archaeon]